ncbi:MAG: hypothetical protein L0191_03155, partial [Acidobacteria bacterium]|nr:hypothetical protein [Acidobacteriota bacterium]
MPVATNRAWAKSLGRLPWWRKPKANGNGSSRAFAKKDDLVEGPDGIMGVWRTIRGRKVFIEEGQSLEDALGSAGRQQGQGGASLEERARRDHYRSSLDQLRAGNWRGREEAVSWAETLRLPRREVMRDLIAAGASYEDALGATKPLRGPVLQRPREQSILPSSAIKRTARGNGHTTSFAKPIEPLKEGETLTINPETGERGVWRNIGGRSVFIAVREGESVPEAVRRSVGEAGGGTGRKRKAESPTRTALRERANALWREEYQTNPSRTAADLREAVATRIVGELASAPQERPAASGLTKLPMDFAQDLGDTWWKHDPIGEDSITLYHVTMKEFADAIEREGFQPGKVVGPFQGFEPRVQGTYGWSSRARAIFEVQRIHENAGTDLNELAVIAVRVPKSAWGKMRADEDNTQTGDWQRSYREGSSVYEGTVPSEWVGGIYTHKGSREMALVKTPHGHDVPLTRAPSRAEQKVDFATIVSEGDRLTSQAVARVKAALTNARDKLLALVRRKHEAVELSTKFVLDLELRGLGQLVPTLREALGAFFRLGQRTADSEVRRGRAGVRLFAKPVEALKEGETLTINPETGERGVWRNIGGRSVFIAVREGESVPEAVKRVAGGRGQPAAIRRRAGTGAVGNVPTILGAIQALPEFPREGTPEYTQAIAEVNARAKTIWPKFRGSSQRFEAGIDNPVALDAARDHADAMGKWTARSRREIAVMIDNRTGKVVGSISKGAQWAAPIDAQLVAATADGDYTHIHTHPTANAPSNGDWNQALMELGATVCTPRKPACPACPLRAW